MNGLCDLVGGSDRHSILQENLRDSAASLIPSVELADKTAVLMPMMASVASSGS